VRFDPSAYADICAEHGIEMIEDYAQTFSGVKESIGHEKAVVSMFSFGLIKVQTTLIGAVAVVRDKALFQEMDKVQSTYPVYSNADFSSKAKKALAAKALFGTKLGIRGFYEFAERFTANREELSVQFVRGFPADVAFLQKFRLQPSKVLLKFMMKRFQRFDQERFDRTSRYLRESQDRLAKAGFFIPGQDQPKRNVWPFPIIVQNSDLFLSYMFTKGVIPYKSSTQCREVKAEGSEYQQCPNTRWLIDNTIYAPINRGISEKDQEILCKRMAEGYQQLLEYGQLVGAKFSDDPLTQKYVFKSRL